MSKYSKLVRPEPIAVQRAVAAAMAPANSVDHKTAYARGGKDEDCNLVAACMPCNRRKWAKPYEEFHQCVIQA